jgi:hypothetical protein
MGFKKPASFCGQRLLDCSATYAGLFIAAFGK